MSLHDYNDSNASLSFQFQVIKRILYAKLKPCRIDNRTASAKIISLTGGHYQGTYWSEYKPTVVIEL
jgi:hypothetical protein